MFNFNIKSKIKNIYWTVVIFLLFSPVSIVLAQLGGTQTAPNKLQNPLKVGTLPEFLDLILKAVVTIATPIIVLMVVYSGFLFIKAQGNPDKLTEAKKAIMWTIIGGIVILGAVVLEKAIEGTVKDLQKGATQSSYMIKLG